MSPTPNADAVASFVTALPDRKLPPEVMEAARMCLVDCLGVAIGAVEEDAAKAVRQAIRSWGRGDAHVLLGQPAPAAAAALINGTMGHCLDFDDTHVGSLAHLSTPAWAAALALGTERDAPPTAMLLAFIAAFETGARLGGGGMGEGLNQRGLHSTGFFGCLAAATASASILGLDGDGVRRSLGAAATQAAGLTASFGTMAKPFHAGKAAFNGVLSAQLAASGFIPADGLLEPGGGFDMALVQDGGLRMSSLDFADGWELLRNTFKPYASCLLTHPVVDAARRLSNAIAAERVKKVRIGVNPMAIQLAGKPAPATPLEGKFSTAFCAALGLGKRSVSAADFTAERLADPELRRLTACAELVAVPDMPKTAAWVEVSAEDGTRREDVPLALGNPGQPMGWDDLAGKFQGLVEPVLGKDAAALFEHARRFQTVGDLAAILRLTTAS